MSSLTFALVMLVGAVEAPAQQLDPRPPGRLRLGLSAVGMPFGRTGDGPPSMPFAAGALVAADYQMGPRVFLGLSSQLTSFENAGSSSWMVDLNFRLGATTGLADGVQVYGYVTPGYSALAVGGSSHRPGPVLGAHAGVGVAVGRGIYGTFQLGYQMRVYRGSDYATFFSHPHLALGALVQL